MTNLFKSNAADLHTNGLKLGAMEFVTLIVYVNRVYFKQSQLSMESFQ